MTSVTCLVGALLKDKNDTKKTRQHMDFHRMQACGILYLSLSLFVD